MPRWTGSTRRARLPRGWTRLRLAVLERDGYVCQLSYPYICVRTATQVDHVVNNDDHSISNLQAACSPCHGRKSAREGHANRVPLRRPPERHPGMIN